MHCSRLKRRDPITDAISNLEFAPRSDNLLFSSWGSSLRFYDVDWSVLRLEAQSEAVLLDCCFSDEDVAFSVGSEGCVRREEHSEFFFFEMDRNDHFSVSAGSSTMELRIPETIA